MQHFSLILKKIITVTAMVLITISITSCASSGGSNNGSQVRSLGGSKVLACKSGDQLVSSSNQCLQDGAACYELSNGKWCTGERGNTCPAGSVQIAENAACPRGTRCIQFGEGLNCAIQIR